MKHKITNSVGIRQIYRTLRKNKYYGISPISDSDFYLIINKVNNMIASFLSTGEKIKLPQKMGELYIMSRKPKVEFIDNQLKTNLPINWKETNKLWKEDLDSCKSKILVRYELDKVYMTRYSVINANYKNKTFYAFRTNKNLRMLIHNNVVNGKLIKCYTYD